MVDALLTTRRPPAAPGKPVGAALAAVRILRHVVEQPLPSSSTDLARALQLNPSTCFNIVRTLVDAGFLESIAASKRYQAGPILNGLAHRLTARSRDFDSIRPAMQSIADRYKVTITLWNRRTPNRMELLVVTTCNAAVNIQMPVGQRLPLLVGGMGRIMALQGGIDPTSRRAFFDQIRWDRPLSFKAFIAQARQAQRQGWGLDDGFMHRAVTAIGVPVRPADGSDGPTRPVEYVCSATMFRNQYSQADLGEIAKALGAVAEQVSRLLTSAGRR